MGLLELKQDLGDFNPFYTYQYRGQLVISKTNKTRPKLGVRIFISFGKLMKRRLIQGLKLYFTKWRYSPNPSHIET